MKKFSLTVLAMSLALITNAWAQTEANPTITQNQTSITNAQTSALTNLQTQYYPNTVTSATFSDTQSALNYIAGAVNLVINYMYNTLTTLMMSQTYNVAQSMAGGAVQQNIVATVDTNATNSGLPLYTFDAGPTPQYYTGQAILDTLTTLNPTNTQLVLTNLTTNTSNGLYALPACTSSGAAVTSTGNCYNPGTPTPSTTVNYNLNSLIGYSYYTTPAQKQNALNFIQFASGLAEPVGTLDMSKCTSSKCLQQPAVAKYLASLRAYAAKQSVGLSTLYEMFAQRNLLMQDQNGNPIHLGQNAGLPTTSPNYPDASPDQVEYYLASRRVNDPNWYASMETANSTTLMRENLYIAAENRMEMMKMRRDIERLTAIIAVMQLEVLRAMQSPTGDTIKDQVNNLNKQSPFSGSGS